MRSYDKSRDNAPGPTLVAYAGLQKRGAYLRDNTVLYYIYISQILIFYCVDEDF